MADQRTADLPEGTDTVIEGANVGAIATDPTAPDKGGQTITIDDTALHQSLIARAAVMCAWYPVLYPDPSPERLEKLRFRLDWLARLSARPEAAARILP